ncbi:MAG: tRNA lysidine(34) synthetase TilS [Meiothermus sp.]|uniref:tRNA lysidine(34) synthetase TilS n=1 Tax=Meiothermus sp. TaxID=1955249 RepID=UPI0025D35A8D|nr:tRNA lysidine(34) synthetase TilS [Meiothermus sp.]MCS7059472.1 tRNA lysidine(34) synthetase TilS [Meiothermus sp.]MCS7193864.1 tRNA lysidine(34) synthetase TilS [Meiothermus sp.]MDW8090189.1 tRNA lysidine(34) synthetase TilS [Meiothermus sp.]MDW8481491.1 tRNA lysidine(34) synthetase TilS [Meiothermus sp.]
MDSTDLERLEAWFANHLTRLVPEGVLVAAVSGGGDSVALLLLLTSTPRKVVVAHLDHALRPDSARDALWVKALAERLGYPFEGERLEVARIAAERGGNLEATARELRYGFLAKVAKKHGAQAVLTAHTEDDQAETVLLQLLQGTGRGLGMRPKRGKVVRPLLEISRQTLREYLRGKGQDWLEDITNADVTLDRNFLRQEILPRLAERFPQAQAALARFAGISQVEDEALDPLARLLLLPDRRWPCPAYRVAPLLQAPPGLRRRALRQMLEEVGVRPESSWILQLERALQGEAFTLPGGWQVRRRDGTLFLIPPVVESFPPWRGSRLPRPGDQIHLPTGRVRLVDFLAGHGVPPELKQVWPVRAVGEEVQEVWNLWPEPEDLVYMRMALSEAERAEKKGEVPIGAVVVQDDQVLARAHNQVEHLRSATAHAELLALHQALLKKGEKVIPGATVYVTLEPCPMCFGALAEAQVRRVVYAVENLKAGALTVHRLTPPFAWEGGWLERDATRLLKGFFSQKRTP